MSAGHDTALENQSAGYPSLGCRSRFVRLLSMERIHAGRQCPVGVILVPPLVILQQLERIVDNCCRFAVVLLSKPCAKQSDRIIVAGITTAVDHDQKSIFVGIVLVLRLVRSATLPGAGAGYWC